MIQSNIRAWMNLKNWNWWKMMQQIRPLLSAAREADEMAKRAAELDKKKEELQALEEFKKNTEAENVMLNQV